jgi:hypothetical protein
MKLLGKNAPCILNNPRNFNKYGSICCSLQYFPNPSKIDNIIVFTLVAIILKACYELLALLNRFRLTLGLYIDSRLALVAL